MKKIKELSKSELKDLLGKNREFENYIYERCYESNMYWQEERGRSIFGERYEGIAVENHYTSFYFRLLNAEKFFYGLNSDELSDRKLYNKAKKLIDEYENLEYDDLNGEKGEQLYEQFEKVCIELMKEIETELRGYENVSDDDFENELDFILDECEFETDGEKVYETITKVYR